MIINEQQPDFRDPTAVTQMAHHRKQRAGGNLPLPDPPRAQVQEAG